MSLLENFNREIAAKVEAVEKDSLRKLDDLEKTADHLAVLPDEILAQIESYHYFKMLNVKLKAFPTDEQIMPMIERTGYLRLLCMKDVFTSITPEIDFESKVHSDLSFCRGFGIFVLTCDEDNKVSVWWQANIAGKRYKFSAPLLLQARMFRKKTQDQPAGYGRKETYKYFAKYLSGATGVTYAQLEKDPNRTDHLVEYPVAFFEAAKSILKVETSPEG